MARSTAALFLALFPGLFLLVEADNQAGRTKKELPLITVGEGDLPIILSAPHGGWQRIPGVAPRSGEEIRRFVTRTDLGTDELAEKLADEIEKNTGKRPYVVIAKFHRKYVDANRPPALAYESPKAKLTYDAYHAALANARSGVEKRFGKGLVIDIHGQATLRETIIRGTQNGKTLKHLIRKFGKESHQGKVSLFGQLQENDFEINPVLDSSTPEHPKFTGGYITRTYGSMNGGIVNAIQVELGRNLRHPENTKKNAQRLFKAIVAFAKDCLPSIEETKKNQDQSLPRDCLRPN